MAKGYWIARVSVHDAEGYKEYVAAAAKAFDRFDVKFLARGGAFRGVEGDARPRNVVIEFPSLAEAQARISDRQGDPPEIRRGRDRPRGRRGSLTGLPRENRLSRRSALVADMQPSATRMLGREAETLRRDSRALV